MLPILIHIQLMLRERLSAALSRDDGQTSAEYALVVVGVAAMALLILAWTKHTSKVGDLLDALFDHVKGQIK